MSGVLGATLAHLKVLVDTAHDVEVQFGRFGEDD
jgi:hypothetical protein